MAQVASIERNNSRLSVHEELAACIIRGDSRRQLTDLLLAHDFSLECAERQIARLARDPVIAAARKACQRANKVNSFLEVRAQLFRQSGFAEQFGRSRPLSAEEFYTRYYFNNLPVLVSGWMDDWPALKTWSPANFRQRFGDLEIEVVADRNSDPKYDQNLDRLCRKMPLKQFVDLIEDKETKNDVYLVARNHFLSLPAVAELNDEIRCPPGVLDPALMGDGFVELWMGSGGTITPLHHDACNILFGQVHGRKRIKLIPPHDIAKVYNVRGVFSEVDLRRPDYERFPLLEQASVLEVIVNPGEFLFIPVGWWHWVESLEPSISLSFQNLCRGSPEIVWAPHVTAQAG